MSAQENCPKGWTTTTVARLCEPLISGFASGAKDVLGGVLHLRMNNISADGALDLSLVRTVPLELAQDRYTLKAGDVLCCTTNSGKLVGKVSQFNENGVWMFSNHLTRLRPILDVLGYRVGGRRTAG